MKKFINEFKTFIARGNVMDMAVGVIIGGAFKAAHNRGYLDAPTLGSPSRIPSRKGGRACAWKRTDKHVPEHLCRQEDAA